MTQASTKKMDLQLVGERELLVKRNFDAPRDLVFKAYSDAESIKQWFTPNEFTMPHCTVDFRPGGTWLYCMRGPDGQDYWGKAEYHEIDAPTRIVYSDAFADPEGNLTSPPMRITVTFDEADGKTKMTISTLFVSQEARDSVVAMGMEEGMSQTLDHLDAFLQRTA